MTEKEVIINAIILVLEAWQETDFNYVLQFSYKGIAEEIYRDIILPNNG